MTALVSPILPALALLCCMASTTSAQSVRLTTPPNAALREEFSDIRGVRELADGRLLVSDYRDERVVLVDLARQTVTPLLTRGSGPREARIPTRLIPGPGDSTLVVDLGNNRLILLDEDGTPVRTILAEHQGILGLRGVDAAGSFYYAVPAWSEPRALPGDSVRLIRWDPRSAREEPIATVQGERMRSDIREPARIPRIPTVGYASQDGWTVDDQGRVRIVRSGGYRIETRAPGAPAAIGPSYAYPTRAVTAADRVAWVRRFMATSPMSGKGPEGGLGQSPAVTEAEVAVLTRGTQFADRHAMFNAGDVVAAPGGILWVGRPMEPGDTARYDLFDAGGRRVSQIQLDPGRRVMAVGRRGAYVAYESGSGIQFLERYSVPYLGQPR